MRYVFARTKRRRRRRSSAPAALGAAAGCELRRVAQLTSFKRAAALASSFAAKARFTKVTLNGYKLDLWIGKGLWVHTRMQLARTAGAGLFGGLLGLPRAPPAPSAGRRCGKGRALRAAHPAEVRDHKCIAKRLIGVTTCCPPLRKDSGKAGRLVLELQHTRQGATLNMTPSNVSAAATPACRGRRRLSFETLTKGRRPGCLAAAPLGTTLTLTGSRRAQCGGCSLRGARGHAACPVGMRATRIWLSTARLVAQLPIRGFHGSSGAPPGALMSANFRTGLFLSGPHRRSISGKLPSATPREQSPRGCVWPTVRRIAKRGAAKAPPPEGAVSKRACRTAVNTAKARGALR